MPFSFITAGESRKKNVREYLSGTLLLIALQLFALAVVLLLVSDDDLNRLFPENSLTLIIGGANLLSGLAMMFTAGIMIVNSLTQDPEDYSTFSNEASLLKELLAVFLGVGGIVTFCVCLIGLYHSLTHASSFESIYSISGSQLLWNGVLFVGSACVGHIAFLNYRKFDAE